jgi:hypothetical protein
MNGTKPSFPAIRATAFFIVFQACLVLLSASPAHSQSFSNLDRERGSTMLKIVKEDIKLFPFKWTP